MLINTNAALIPLMAWQGREMRAAFEILRREKHMSTAAYRQAPPAPQPVKPLIADLERYIADAFEGENPAVNVGAAPDVETAEQMVIAAIEASAPRSLSAWEKGVVGMEVGLAWNRRAIERRANLADIQQRLASPAGRMFA